MAGRQSAEKGKKQQISRQLFARLASTLPVRTYILVYVRYFEAHSPFICAGFRMLPVDCDLPGRLELTVSKPSFSTICPFDTALKNNKSMRHDSDPFNVTVITKKRQHMRNSLANRVSAFQYVGHMCGLGVDCDPCGRGDMPIHSF